MSTAEALPSDEQLARRAREGCRASFEELVRRFQVPLVHFLCRRTSTEEAEDLTQETMLRAYRNLHRFEPDRRFSTWLFTIARRLHLNRLRERQGPREEVALESIPTTDPLPETVVAGEEQRRRLWALAEALLTEPECTGLWLYYVEGMSTEQIARVLERSRTAIKTMLFRARRRLMPALKQLDASDEEPKSSEEMSHGETHR